ncbi:MAG: hypothetical protein ACI9EW_001700 [Cellvibrionaceae bacterium]|jgi:hypothetical protein
MAIDQTAGLITKSGMQIIRLLNGRQYSKESYRLIDFPQDLETMSEAERRKLHFLKGHFCFGIHESLFTSWHYVTIMRDPIKRVRSLYGQAKR